MPVIFDEKTHTYLNPETKEYYTGCSSFLSQFEHQFDPTGQILVGSAKKASKERGITITPQMLKQEWTNKADYSKAMGTAIHYSLEQMILDNDTKESEELEKIKDKFKTIFSSFDGKIVPEVLLYNDLLKISGTSDLVFYHADGKTISIGDFKTNEEINTTSKYNQYLLDPVSHLQHSNWTHYSLQLSFYAYMMELQGYKVKDLYLYHIIVDKDQSLTKTGETITNNWKFNSVKRIACQYMKTDIQAMLKYWVVKNALK